jgi:hypothetical protein
MTPIDRDLQRERHPDEPDATPDALDRLLGELRVEVRSGFAMEVMARLPEPAWRPRRSASREWVLAAVLAAVLVAVAALLLSSGGSEQGVGTSVIDLLVATLLAGAGFLAASWGGIGATVDAALDGSIGALVALGLAAVAANGLLVLLLRRRRAAARARDDS